MSMGAVLIKRMGVARNWFLLKYQNSYPYIKRINQKDGGILTIQIDIEKILKKYNEIMQIIFRNECVVETSI